MDKPKTLAEKQTETMVDTIGFTPADVMKWELPPGIQRGVTINEKVRDLAEAIKRDGGVLPGVLTLGWVAEEPWKNKTQFLVDGQQRREAFYISGRQDGYADVRVCFFKTLADLAAEFIRLNSSLVSMKPDDILRPMELMNENLANLRKACPFVGYDFIRRGESSPMVGMATTLRAWAYSGRDIPGAVSKSAATLAGEFTSEDSIWLSRFLTIAMNAWGKYIAYQRLWLTLNLILCMWLYRRTVLTQYSPKQKRMTDSMFQKCLMSLSASEVYLDWLVGRRLTDRDRAPAYQRVKELFAERLHLETGERWTLPAPPWTLGKKG